MFFGPISSIFDYATFFAMLYVFNAAANAPLFHTGWFVESLLTQTIIIHVIRTDRIPFVQSIASPRLIATSLIIMAVGVWLPFSPFAEDLGFAALPPLYWAFLLAALVCYVILTQLVKGLVLSRISGNGEKPRQAAA